MLRTWEVQIQILAMSQVQTWAYCQHSHGLQIERAGGFVDVAVVRVQHVRENVHLCVCVCMCLKQCTVSQCCRRYLSSPRVPPPPSPPPHARNARTYTLSRAHTRIHPPALPARFVLLVTPSPPLAHSPRRRQGLASAQARQMLPAGVDWYPLLRRRHPCRRCLRHLGYSFSMTLSEHEHHHLHHHHHTSRIRTLLPPPRSTTRLLGGGNRLMGV